ncbi:MAG: amidohydrolase family protein [Chloroflexi bacterium]|nr:amidohydrolase family protein [Chloroflexota bacterium]
MFDLLIRGGMLIDGAGGAARRADVGVNGAVIADVGDLHGQDAATVIDADGLTVTPGFVDTHAHSDGSLLVDGQEAHALRQGVTTQIITQDGMGFAPLTHERYAEYAGYLAGILGEPPLELDMSSIAAMRRNYDGKATNVAVLVPHGALRLAVAGFADRPLRGELLDRARALVAQGMAEGAHGLSTGLSYYPQSYSDTDELVALAEVVRDHGGVYVTHVRNHNNERAPEGSGVIEAMTIGRRSGVAVHVSHYKTNAPNAGEIAELVAPIDAAKREGVDVTVECYPYAANSTVPGYFLRGEFHEGGPDALLTRLADPGLRPAMIDSLRTLFPGALERACWSHVASAANADLPGMAFVDVAAARGVSVEEMVLDVMREERLACGFRSIPPASAALTRAVEADAIALLLRDDYTLGSDGIPTGAMPHPRAWGSFARVIGPLRRRHDAPLEALVHALATRPARRFGLTGRGTIEPGAFADLVAMDAPRVHDLATYEDPKQHPTGIEHVVVNGQIAVRDGQSTGVMAGRVV